ncbi:hypothetical protein CLAIMM_13264 isoform 2, partial [Cladophialophora immunda]
GGPACGLSGSCVERYRGSLQQTMPVRLGSLGFRRINPGRLDTSNAAAEKVVPPVHPNLQQPTIHGCAHCSPSIQGRPWWALHLHLHLTPPPARDKKTPPPPSLALQPTVTTNVPQLLSSA